MGIPAYASSKGAICSLTRQMALDYSSHGVRVLAVSPGTIRTAHLEADLIAQGQSCEGLGSRYPLGRMGEPSDVAELCVYLASERARNMTGANVCCDGGIAAMGCWDQRVGTRSYLSERR